MRRTTILILSLVTACSPDLTGVEEGLECLACPVTGQCRRRSGTPAGGSFGL